MLLVLHGTYICAKEIIEEMLRASDISWKHLEDSSYFIDQGAYVGVLFGFFLFFFFLLLLITVVSFRREHTLNQSFFFFFKCEKWQDWLPYSLLFVEVNLCIADEFELSIWLVKIFPKYVCHLGLWLDVYNTWNCESGCWIGGFKLPHGFTKWELFYRVNLFQLFWLLSSVKPFLEMRIEPVIEFCLWENWLFE